MCGIAGILTHGSAQVDRKDLATIAHSLAHRGPDGEGIWISRDGCAGLVHRRLAILDTTALSNQPMQSEDGRLTIVFNGEIYNFIELRDELAKLGWKFSSDGDTEVILAAWQQWGEGMLPRFNGMWALAIHDSSKGDVFFARDRFGIKPLLYTLAGGRLAFASEMKTLLKLPWVSAELSADVTRRMLFDPFGVEGSEFSIYASIRRLPAGHFARWNKSELSVRRWWCTVDNLVEVPASEEEQAERFHELFTDAVRLRMRSDVKLGTCLSGGFDSSAIACTMATASRSINPNFREAADWRHAYIASFPGQSNDETPSALEAATWAGVKPHVMNVSQIDDEARIGQILHDLDDLYIGLPSAPWQIYCALRSHGTVVSLDGHGADELMGGYRQDGDYLGFALRNGVAAVSNWSQTAAVAVDSAKMAWLSARGLAFLRGGVTSVPSALEIAADRDKLPSHWGVLNRRLYRMFHSTVLPTILRNFDRLSMAHGVEVRMPFMDWRLVTYVMSLPDSAKLQGNLSKFVARNAMIGRMPESIRSSALKVGFNSPMPEWLNGPLGNWAINILSRSNPEFAMYVNRKDLIKRVRELTMLKKWDWTSSGRLWPYINLKWILDVRSNQGVEAQDGYSLSMQTLV